MGYRSDYRVRYSECDQQGVVFNSWYMAYIDDAFDMWLRQLDESFEDRGWEVMVKRCEIVWHDSARHKEIFTLDCEVTRWGNTSLDVAMRGHVGDRHCLDANLVYVAVDTADHRPIPVPADLKRHLSR